MENFRTRPDDQVGGLRRHAPRRGQEHPVDLLSRSIARLFGGF
jgi:hypothetical protein